MDAPPVEGFPEEEKPAQDFSYEIEPLDGQVVLRVFDSDGNYEFTMEPDSALTMGQELLSACGEALAQRRG